MTLQRLPEMYFVIGTLIIDTKDHRIWYGVILVIVGNGLMVLKVPGVVMVKEVNGLRITRHLQLVTIPSAMEQHLDQLRSRSTLLLDNTIRNNEICVYQIKTNDM